MRFTPVSIASSDHDARRLGILAVLERPVEVMRVRDADGRGRGRVLQQQRAAHQAARVVRVVPRLALKEQGLSDADGRVHERRARVALLGPLHDRLGRRGVASDARVLPHLLNGGAKWCEWVTNCSADAALTFSKPIHTDSVLPTDPDVSMSECHG
jgi:hypothetical protein